MALAAAPSAMARFQEGMALYKAGNCEQALVAFEEAQRLKPGGALLRKISECKEKLGDLPGARQALATYLADPKAVERNAVIAELARIDAQAKAQAEADAKARADAEAKAKAQAEADAKAQAQADAKAQADADAKARTQADAKAQADARARAEPEAQAQPPPPPAPLVASDEAPTLDHRPLAQVEPGRSAVLRARVTAPPGRRVAARLLVRPAGVAGFSPVRMEAEPAAPELYASKLTPNFSDDGFDYYLELLDEGGRAIARVGSANEPLHVSPLSPALLAKELPLPPLPPTGISPSPASRGWAVATAVLAGAALAGGVGLTVAARSTLADYDDGRLRDNYQEVSYQDARESAELSKVGLGVLGGAAALLTLSIVLVY